MTPNEEILLRVAGHLIRRLRLLSAKVRQITGSDVLNLSDCIAIGDGFGIGGEGGNGAEESESLVIVKITSGSSNALGGCYAGKIVTRNSTELRSSTAGTFNASTYFTDGADVTIINLYEDATSGHILDVSGETYYTFGILDTLPDVNGTPVVFIATPGLRSPCS